MSAQQKVNPFGLRMPDDLKKWVVEAAANDHRSTNNFIVACLENLRAQKRPEQRDVQ